MSTQLLTNLTLWQLTCVAAILAGTTILTARCAFFPRRRGDTPFCPRCRYDLSGVDFDLPAVKCAECGRVTPSNKVIRGVRPRRRGMRLATVVLGFLTLGTTAVWTTLASQRINWRNYAPELFLRRDLASADIATLKATVEEFTTRQKTGRLSSDTLNQLIELGLAEQASTQTTPRTTLLVTALCIFVERKAVPEAQLQRFLDQAVRLSPIRTRPNAPIGATFTVECDSECRVALPVGVGSKWRPNELRIDGKVSNYSLSEEAPMLWGATVGKSRTLRYSGTEYRPGFKKIELDLNVVVLLGSAPIGERELRQSATLQFVDQKFVQPVRPNTDPAILESVRSAIRLAYVDDPAPAKYGRPTPPGTDVWLRITIGQPFSENLRFTLYGESDGMLDPLPFQIDLASGLRLRFMECPLTKRYDRIHLDPDFDRALSQTLWEQIVGQRLVFSVIPNRCVDPESRPTSSVASSEADGVQGHWGPPLRPEQRPRRTFDRSGWLPGS